MTDIRQISVETRTIQDFEVDVDDWFIEFEEEWLDFLGSDQPSVKAREEFIKESAYELAAFGGMGPVRFEDHDVDIFITKVKN